MRQASSIVPSDSRQKSDLFDIFADDLLVERNAKPLIIVGASKVDDLLLEMLRSYLLPKLSKGKKQDELLEGDTPLATFSARIKMCRRLGLIDETLYLALERLRPLRNLSAHSISFDHTRSPARELVAEVRSKIVNRRSYELTKHRFFGTDPLKPIEELQCLLLTMCAVLEAIHAKVTSASGNNAVLRIAARYGK